MPPSSAGASSNEDKANSYNHYSYSASLDHSLADPRGGDGDARHIAMKSIRMRQRKSMSPINSYAESNKYKLWSKAPVWRTPSQESQFFNEKASLEDSLHLSGQAQAGFPETPRYGPRNSPPSRERARIDHAGASQSLWRSLERQREVQYSLYRVGAEEPKQLAAQSGPLGAHRVGAQRYNSGNGAVDLNHNLAANACLARPKKISGLTTQHLARRWLQKGQGERMKGILMFGAIAASGLALSAPARARLAQDPKEKPAGEAQVIEVTARKYEFAPGEIHVTKGSRVR